MGYMRHRAVVVTSWSEDHILEAHKRAAGAMGSTPSWVSPISPPCVNAYRSFMIAPCGSKNGWSEADDHNERVDQFVESLSGLYVDAAVATWGESPSDMGIAVARYSEEDGLA